MSIKSKIAKLWFSRRQRAIEHFRRNPIEVQHKMFRQLIGRGANTAFGHDYELKSIGSIEQFQSKVELFDYDNFKHYIERMVKGERNVTTRGTVKLFARSSGTTSDRSKYIPITNESVWWNHTQGMRDMATIYFGNNPSTKLFDGKTLTLGGSYTREGGALVGDLSSLLLYKTRFVGTSLRAPHPKTAVIPNFDEKCEAIVRECVKQNIVAFAGVPSWNLALMRHVLEHTGKQNLLEVWPNMELFAHGGVEFTPYRSSFEALIPSSQMNYLETYNASEGFFALADDPTRNDMLLMLDYGTFYEFRKGDDIVPLEGVKCGEKYAILISSNNGLWRYELGDMVEFTSTDPYRIRFAGRTRQYINVFGEELIVDNADNAMTAACRRTDASVREYTVAPMYMSISERGAHQWAIEFEREPKDMELFSKVLDEELCAINSDYDAKRKTTLEPQHISIMPQGHFLSWLQARGKNKVPRLMNDRRVMDDILKFDN